MSWDRKPCKGPLIEEPRNPHVKSRKGKKPFVIEARHQPASPPWGSGFLFNHYSRMRKWHVWKRYKTKKQRDRALQSIRKQNWEFRAGEDS